MKVLDFGVAKLAPGMRAGDTELEDPLTMAGDIFGTAVYMSPEQARGEELDARTDLFSLGVVLYQMATGQRPFTGNNAVATMAAIMTHKPVSPLKLNPKLPPELEGIIGRAMEKERGKRYPDALAMKGDLQSLKRETEPGMTDTARMRPLLPYRISSSTFQTTSRKSLYILLGVIALLITLLIPMGAWFFKQRANAPRPYQRCRAAAAKHEWRCERRLPALRAGRRGGQRADQHPHPRRASILDVAQVRRRRCRSPQVRPRNFASGPS